MVVEKLAGLQDAIDHIMADAFGNYVSKNHAPQIEAMYLDLLRHRIEHTFFHCKELVLVADVNYNAAEAARTRQYLIGLDIATYENHQVLREFLDIKRSERRLGKMLVIDEQYGFEPDLLEEDCNGNVLTPLESALLLPGEFDIVRKRELVAGSIYDVLRFGARRRSN